MEGIRAEWQKTAVLLGVPPEHPGGAELAELMADHVFRAENVGEVPTVMHLEDVADELGNDGARSRPGLDGEALVLRIEPLNLPVKLLVNVWAFLERS